MAVIVIDNEIAIVKDDTTFNLVSWAKRNLTFTNPEFAKRIRYGKSTYATPRDIVLYREDSEFLYIPYGMLDRLEKYADATHIDLQIVDKLSLKERTKKVLPSIPLFDFQETAREKMMQSKGGILQSPAGTGKTQIGLAIAQTLGLKTLWLTHTKDLLNQSKTRAEKYFDSTLMGTITDGKIDIGSWITFATVQTMANINLPLYKDEWDVVIVDECHRVCGSATAVKQFQKVLENLATRYRFGLTATPHRADGLIETAFALLGEVKYVIPDEAVKDFITPISIKTIKTNIPMSEEALNEDGTVNFNKLINYISTNEERNKLITETMIFNFANSNLILSDRLEHLHTLYNMLPKAYQKRAVIIDGNMVSKSGKESRSKYLDEMRNGKKNFLFATYRLAKEGLDIPCLDRLYLATPQKDYAIIIQSIGRVARSFENKSKPVVYDFVDNNIPSLRRFYTERLRHYKREGCEIL